MTKFDLLTPNQKSWIIECWSCFPNFQHYAAADCVDGFPEELDALQKLADEDENFIYLVEEWEDYVSQNFLYVLLEQSCDDSVMLSLGQISERLRECPREWLAPFETLLRQCPPHVLAYLAQRYYLTVRMDRVERTGKPGWKPSNGPFSHPDWEDSSWKRASFVVRKYNR